MAPRSSKKPRVIYAKNMDLLTTGCGRQDTFPALKKGPVFHPGFDRSTADHDHCTLSQNKPKEIISFFAISGTLRCEGWGSRGIFPRPFSL
jgi:hypothetical protein